jgi:hypothetical protein
VSTDKRRRRATRCAGTRPPLPHDPTRLVTEPVPPRGVGAARRASWARCERPPPRWTAPTRMRGGATTSPERQSGRDHDRCRLFLPPASGSANMPCSMSAQSAGPDTRPGRTFFSPPRAWVDPRLGAALSRPVSMRRYKLGGRSLRPRRHGQVHALGAASARPRGHGQLHAVGAALSRRRGLGLMHAPGPAPSRRRGDGSTPARYSRASSALSRRGFELKAHEHRIASFGPEGKIVAYCQGSAPEINIAVRSGAERFVPGTSPFDRLTVRWAPRGAAAPVPTCRRLLLFIYGPAVLQARGRRPRCPRPRRPTGLAPAPRRFAPPVSEGGCNLRRVDPGDRRSNAVADIAVSRETAEPYAGNPRARRGTSPPEASPMSHTTVPPAQLGDPGPRGSRRIRSGMPVAAMPPLWALRTPGMYADAPARTLADTRVMDACKLGHAGTREGLAPEGAVR